MDLVSSLRVFCRVAERRHFAAAAKDLKVSQATATRAVQALERQFQVELIRRSTRELALTEAGMRLHRRASELLVSLADLQNDIAGNGREPSGSLRVTAPSAFGVTVMAPIAAHFRSRFPEVSLDIVLTDRFLDLIAENIDLAVRVGSQSDSRLMRRKIGSLPEVLVASSTYLSRTMMPVTPSDLDAHDFVSLSILRSERTGLTLENRRGEQTTVRMKEGLAFDTPLGVREAVLAGGGIGRIHLYLVTKDLDHGDLVEVLPDWRCPDWELALVSTARERSRAAEVFEETLRHALDGMRGVQVLPS